MHTEILETPALNDHHGYNEILGKFDHKSSTIFYIFDLDTSKILFVSKSIEKLTGITDERFMREGLALFASIIHTDDFQSVQTQYAKAVAMIQSNDAELIDPNHQLYNEFRIGTTEGNDVWVEVDAMVLNFGQEETNRIFGTIRNINYKKGVMAINQDDSTPRKKSTPISKRTLSRPFSINLKKGPSEKVTPREMEVLQLVAHGFSAKQIADKLFISIHTAINHRKNLIEKFKVKNTAELILRASKTYWL